VKTANGKFRVSAKCRSCGSELSSFRQEYIDIVKNNKKR